MCSLAKSYDNNTVNFRHNIQLWSLCESLFNDIR
jgi:hypothetical protein